MPRNLTLMLSVFRTTFPTNTNPLKHVQTSWNFQASHISRAQKVASSYPNYQVKTSGLIAINRFADIINAKQNNNAIPKNQGLSSELLSRLAIAAMTHKPPAIPTSVKANPKNLPLLKIDVNEKKNAPLSPRSILKSPKVPSPIHAIPELSPSQIFQFILDYNLLSERKEYEKEGEFSLESDEEYKERVMNILKTLTPKERYELAEIANGIRGTSHHTAKLNPSEKPEKILTRLNIPNENRKRTNYHNERLEEHSYARLKFNAQVGLFKVANSTQKVSLKLNELDRQVGSLETVLCNDQSGATKTKRVLRTFYPRDTTDEFSIKNQLLQNRCK